MSARSGRDAGAAWAGEAASSRQGNPPRTSAEVLPFPAPRSPAPIAPADLAAAAPDLAMGALFLATWIAPTAFREKMVAYLLAVMLLEFIIVHSSAFMGNVVLGKASPGGKIAALVGLGGFYTLFVGAFALVFRAWWPLWNFWGLTLNRVLGVLVGQAPSGEERIFLQRNWAASVMFYLLGVFVTTLAPLPRLGITPDVVARQQLPSSGLWVEQPHRVVAFGFIYFTAVGVSELFRHRWIKASHLPRNG